MAEPRKRKRVVKLDESKPTLKIEDGKVVEVPLPEVIEEEVVVDEEEVDNGKPRWVVHTPNGDAIYEFIGNCFDCEIEKVEMPVFVCKTHPIRADAELGNQLAAIYNEGGTVPICWKHHLRRQGQNAPPSAVEYKIIEKRM